MVVWKPEIWKPICAGVDKQGMNWKKHLTFTCKVLATYELALEPQPSCTTI